jgi:trehalose/maltose hydrolase-like predicted phosphorylase
MFPWQSGSDGRDETPTMLYNPLAGHWMPDRSRHQRHVGLAIAYCAWQHWQVTGDFEFLAGPGAELVLEVARFFASLASPASDGGGERGGGERARYHIAGVMGPDEFHDGYPWSDEPGVTDNAYTNVMTAWLLRRAAEVVELLRSARRTAVLDRLALDETEIGRWNDVSSRLTVPFHDGVISQFAGYERLEPIDLDAYRSRYGNIGRMDLILDAEGDTVRRYQVGKQADVLMLFYLLSAEELRAVLGQMGYALEPELIRRTVEYYARRVTHGSTLSSIVHAWVLARADRHASWQYFEQALASDIADVQGGTTREGIHFGAMGGTADLLQRCYTGLELRGEALWLNPKLPAELQRLALTLVFREMLVGVEVDHERLVVRAAAGRAAPITVVLRGEPAVLHPGRLVEVPLQG